MSMPLELSKASTLGHTCYFYEDEHDRLELLVEYLEQGVKNNELCIYVTSYDLPEIKNILTEENESLGKAIASGGIQIFGTKSTYMLSGRFVADYMLSNLESFIEDAHSQGYNGLRTVGEMQWVFHNSDKVENSLFYEKLVNKLNISEPAFVGLCLYPDDTLSMKESDDILKVHPTVVYKDRIMKSPLYAN